MSWRWHDNQVSNGNAKQIFGRKQKAKKGEFLPSQVTRKGGNTGKGISYVWGRFSPFWQCIQKYFDCVRIKIDVSKWKSSSSSSVMMVSIRISVRGTGVSVWGAYANQAVTLLITNTAEIHSSSRLHFQQDTCMQWMNLQLVRSHKRGVSEIFSSTQCLGHSVQF